MMFVTGAATNSLYHPYVAAQPESQLFALWVKDLRMREKSRLLLFRWCNGSKCEYGFLFQFCNVKSCLYLSAFYTFLRIWCMEVGQGDCGQSLKYNIPAFRSHLRLFFSINYGRLRRKEQRCTCSVDDTCGPRQDQRHPFQGSYSSGEWRMAPAHLLA